MGKAPELEKRKPLTGKPIFQKFTRRNAPAIIIVLQYHRRESKQAELGQHCS